MFDQYQEIFFLSLLVFLGILLVWNIFLQISTNRIKKNQKIFFSGSKGKDLEGVILQLKSKTGTLDTDVKDLYDISSKIHQLAHKGIHRVGVVRFNPFKDIGGDQSFAVALLDGDDNGLVISSLYSREGVRVYTKSLLGGQTKKYPLTEEEKQAIRIASSEKEPFQTR